MGERPIPPRLDVEAAVRVDAVHTSLRDRSVRGTRATLTAQASKFVITVAATAALGRILTPADFGLLAMATAVTNFLNQFRDFGLNFSTIHKEDITHDQVSALFWLNVGLGLLLAIGVAAVAPLAAALYQRPVVLPLLLSLASIYVVAGLMTQAQALLQRQMRFVTLATIEITSVIVAAGSAILLAARGAGVWALAAQQILLVVGPTIGVWLVVRWRPSWPRRVAGLRGLLRYGGNLTGSSVLVALSRNADKALVGWAHGAAALGNYAKAWQLLLLPLQQINLPITAVAVPALSRLQDDPGRFRRFYRFGLRLAAALSFPLVVFTFVAADEIVRLVLGSQWGETVPIFRAMAPASLVGGLDIACGWVYLALGRTDRQLRWNALAAAVIIAAIGGGVPFGPVGVALAFSIAICGLQPAAFAYCFRGTSLRMRDLLAEIWRPLIAAGVAGVGLWWLQNALLPSAGLVLTLLRGVVLFVSLYLAALAALPDGVRQLREALRLVRGGKARDESDTL